MIILCVLDSPDPQTCKSAKNRQSKICMNTKVHHILYNVELTQKKNHVGRRGHEIERDNDVLQLPHLFT